MNDPENGEVQVTGTAIDSTATYTCNEGFELSKEAVDGQTCVRAVGWSPDLDERICNSGRPDIDFILINVVNLRYFLSFSFFCCVQWTHTTHSNCDGGSGVLILLKTTLHKHKTQFVK